MPFNSLSSSSSSSSAAAAACNSFSSAPTHRRNLICAPRVHIRNCCLIIPRPNLTVLFRAWLFLKGKAMINAGQFLPCWLLHCISMANLTVKQPHRRSRKHIYI
ncbi:hypothetical protein OIU84_003209 [Salix udensis]|uniref:Uncharacterized protein n=1 Tax=Salix udensis TaxID=889485 RepID=A0AAD6K5V7_9ROSI|nr:hypothetical protein OIU84_003209 [Salix udensis]